jgi:hypothetical protein
MSAASRNSCYTQETPLEATLYGFSDTGVELFKLICDKRYNPIILPKKTEELGQNQSLLSYKEKEERDIVERDYLVWERHIRGIS